MTQRPHLLFLVSFAAVVVLGGGFAKFRFEKLKRSALQKSNPLLDARLLERFPRAWVRPEIRTPRKAKESELSWGYSFRNPYERSGIAIDLKDSVSVFTSLFPGYSKEKLSVRDWSAYYTGGLTGTIWSDVLTGYESAGVSVLHPWPGCLVWFENQGADVVYFGTSHTERSVVPALLSSALPNRPKTLNCARHSLTLEGNLALVEKMKRTGKRVSWAVLGLSYWQFHLTSPHLEKLARDQEKALQESLGNQHSSFQIDLHSKLSDYFRLPGWDRLFPPQLKQWATFRNTMSHQPVKRVREKVARVIEVERPASELTVRKVPYTNPVWDGADDSTCKGDRYQIQVEKLVHSLNGFSDNLLIYVPPTTPLYEELVPPCLVKKTKAWIAAIDSKVVIVKDWRDWGLNYEHFVVATQEKGSIGLLDPSHVNYEGARVITQTLARAITTSQRHYP